MEQIRILMTVFGIVVAFAAVLLSAKSVAAQDVKPSWATWKLEMYGDSGRAHAIWYVTVGGDEDGGGPVALHVEPIRLDCRAVDSAGVVGNTLHFKGGYFECDFPDLIVEANRIISRHWSEEYLLKGGGECNCAPIKLAYAEADLTMERATASAIFYHPTIRFGLTAQGNQVSNYFYFGGRDSTSNLVDPQKQAILKSDYVCDNGGEDCLFEHFVDGQNIGTEKQAPFQPVMSTNPVTVYVGGDRSGVRPFLGSIERLIVDPGCRVH